MTVHIRFARPGDAATIHGFVSELAEFEREPDAVEATPADIEAQLASEKPPFECLIAEIEVQAAMEPCGIALFFHNYSTWSGRRGLYLEDLYVPTRWRGKGVGKSLFQKLAQVAVERNCGRFEWCVLDWNRPAIDFYLAHGATAMEGWTTYRLTGQALKNVADESPSSTP